MSRSPAISGIRHGLRRACSELERRLRRGQICRAEDFFAELPELAEHSDCALELIYTEFVVREQLRQRPRPEEWYIRFPRWRDDLSQLFQVHRLAGDTCAGDSRGPATVLDTDTSQRKGARPRGRFGNYQIIEEVGRGGMGVVYRARQIRPQRDVALKVLLSGKDAGPRERARFRVEIQAIARLHHPNIVQIYEVGETDDQPFFSQELLAGGSLQRQLQGQPWPPRQAANLVEALARAVQHAHERGVVHRDLKPGNVVFTADGVPKIADFGLAMLRSDEQRLTPPGAILGTPGYMAPEQASEGKQEVGPEADIYALGAILYECLTGRPLVSMETPKASHDLDFICRKCLEKDQTKRYQSARALAEDLRRFLDGRPVLARSGGPIYRFRKFAGRNQTLAAAVMVVGLALLVGLAGVIDAERQTRKRAAASLARTGQLALQRGDGRSALASFDQALKAGHPDTVELRLLRVRALCALRQFSLAYDQLESLSGRDDLNEWEGSVRLWQADVALARSMEAEQTLVLVRQALDGKLSPAERAYALGLLAETSPEAVDHFRRVVMLDPVHSRARAMLGLLLLTLGRRSEAAEQVGAGELLFPDDPAFRVLRAWIRAAEGKSDLPAARPVLQLSRQVRDLEALLDEPEVRVPLALLRIGPCAARAWAVLCPPQGSSQSTRVPLPPVLRKIVRSLSGVLPGLLLGQDQNRAITALSQTVKIHPECLLYLVLGALLAQQDRWDEAEKAFQKARETPALVPMRKMALICDKRIGPGEERNKIR